MVGIRCGELIAKSSINILVLQIEVRREYLNRGGGLDISRLATWRDATTADLTAALSPSPLIFQPEKCPEKSPSENQMEMELRNHERSFAR